MAYVLDPNMDDDQQKAQQAAQGAEGQGTVLSGPSAAVAPAGGSGAAKQAAPTQSGMYTNLNSYLDANQGQGARMAGDVGMHIQGDADKADAEGQTWQHAAKDMIDKNRVHDTAGVQQTFEHRDNKGVAAIAQPDFDNAYNAEYLGPKDSSEAGDQSKALAAYGRVQQAGKLAGGNDTDRGVLLGQTYGGDGKKYTNGENLLDSWLTGASPDASNPNGADNAFAGITKKYGTYTDGLKGLNDEVDTLATGAIGDATTLREGTRKAVTGYQGDSDAAIALAAQKAGENNKVLQAQIAAARGGDVNALLALGYSPTAANYAHNGAYNFNPTAFVGQAQDYGAGDFLAPDIAAAYPHLAELLGGAGKTVPLMDTSLATTGAIGGLGRMGLTPEQIAAVNASAEGVRMEHLADYEPDTIGTPSATFYNNNTPMLKTTNVNPNLNPNALDPDVEAPVEQPWRPFWMDQNPQPKDGLAPFRD